jgi:hypothetical protein
MTTLGPDIDGCQRGKDEKNTHNKKPAIGHTICDQKIKPFHQQYNEFYDFTI